MIRKVIRRLGGEKRIEHTKTAINRRMEVYSQSPFELLRCKYNSSTLILSLSQHSIVQNMNYCNDHV